MDMSVNIAGVEWKNPVTVASGTFGSGAEFADYVDINKLGAVTTKGVANVPWVGNPTPRVAEVYGGMMNAIGLQNPGIDLFDLSGKFLYMMCILTKCKESCVYIRAGNINLHHINWLICQTFHHCQIFFRRMTAYIYNDLCIILFQKRNIPLTEKIDTRILQTNRIHHVEELTAQIKKIAKQPVIMKLTPNVTDITEIAKGAEAGGADAVSLINTLTGMKIDINRKTFALANKTGGVSGPIVKPIAVRMVYQVAQAVNIPIIGMGGISCAEDAIEFILAGASAVSVGTANFHNPAVTLEVIDGIEAYMKKNGFNSVKEMVGIVK